MNTKWLQPLMFSVFLAAVQFARAEDTNSVLPMPKGFEGVRLGMSMGELVNRRTNIISVWHHSPDGTVDFARTNQTLHEICKVDPVWGDLGTNVLAGSLWSYVFKGGQLREVSATWVGDIQKIRNYQSALLSWCVRTWGKDFQRRARTVNRGSKLEQLSPFLIWHKADIVIVVTCTSNLNASLEAGAFALSVFYSDETHILHAFSGEKVEPELLNELFKGIGLDAN
jgi:hypothetical protein